MKHKIAAGVPRVWVVIRGVGTCICAPKKKCFELFVSVLCTWIFGVRLMRHRVGGVAIGAYLRLDLSYVRAISAPVGELSGITIFSRPR